MLGGRRRDERLDLGPSAAPLLDALTRRISALTDELVVHEARRSPWTAFYRGRNLIALARASPTGGSLDVAAPGIAWATTLTRTADVDDVELAANLRRAVERAPEAGSRGFWAAIYGGTGAIGTLITIASLVVAFVNWVLRTHNERAVAAATGTQGKLAILNAARREENLRSNSLEIGCLGAIFVGFASFLFVIFVGAWLASMGMSVVAAAALWLIPLPVAVGVFWSVRRRFPSAPQTRSERWLGRVIVLGLVGLVVFLAIQALTSRQ